MPYNALPSLASIYIIYVLNRARSIYEFLYLRCYNSSTEGDNCVLHVHARQQMNIKFMSM